jgi:uncharacterized protein YqeY
VLTDEIRKAMVAAMKAKQGVRKDILKTALGELQTAEARGGGPLDDEAAQKVLRKLIKSIEESLEVVRDEPTREKLVEEKDVLLELLPKQLSVEEIVAALQPVGDDIRGAKADGPAVGVAMKHLKRAGAVVDGKDVSAAVRSIRDGA